MVLDSLPQTFHQGRVLTQLHQSDQTPLLWGSLAFSALSIAYLVAVFEVDIDKDTNYRQLFKKVHGYIVAERRGIIVAGIAMFASGYLVSKVIAISVLGIGSSPILR